MTNFLIYPAIDANYSFPVEVRQAIADSPEVLAKYTTKIESNSKLNVSARGTANGVAPIGLDSKVPDGNLPDRLSDTSLTAAWDTRGAANVDNVSSSWWTALLAKLKTIFVQKGDVYLRAEDYPNFQAALDAAATARKDLTFSSTYNLSSGINWDSTKHSVIGTGRATLDFSTMTSGVAVTINGQTGAGGSDGFFSTINEMVGIKVIGPDVDSTTVDGFKIEGLYNASNVTFNRMWVYGFRDSVYYGDNTWCIRWNNSLFGHFHRYGINCQSLTNAGENYIFDGCTIYSGHNATNNATAIYTAATGNSDINWVGGSLDYNDIEIDHNSGVITLTGAHFENRSELNPFVKLSYTGGLERTLFVMIGGGFAPTETNTNRTSIIDVVSGNAVFVDLTGIKWGLWGKQPELIRNLSGSTPNNAIRGGDIGTGGSGMQSLPGPGFNSLANPGFESGIRDPWVNGGTVTWDYANNTIKASGTYALKVVGTGVIGSTNAKQSVACRPGQQVFISSKVYAQSITSGKFEVQLRFYSADGTVQVGYNALVTLTDTNGGFVDYRNRYVVPPGAGTATIFLSPTDMAGTVYVDDNYVAVI